ncbi:sulfate/thiosulfate ABC transporter ATP-binding protein CysA [Serratia marcescens]|uniref:sulfate/thiosulfate ABC transporter ATP-binding protein CysA n=4 Tax=Serratia TaxID=613 RepID=UPI000F7D68CA|nr:sulfate/thiosulfate ABC transporter ATP-binding protein CysA [Serratia marcescens]RTF71733.1 sulfate/thiosulfate ABC transporter ATP-binding protein CysA [Serratia marcescens]RTF93866.1 sulfate/thiosulfate ABC transporter ATP-binding protein CysA [Serratia marcescens]RTG22050.1 sulfate/thiosulfate ABC transporter ATP-binding protein CysA [Serratia marcescens]RTG63084.1 sulfate/thiosulfate ABC transporter ATP-binding protein CysA [Serratia marcescens]RTG65750.1 sulfate/thiosulfate ABC transp
MAYLNVTRLNKHYGQTQVFQDIDFTAEEGEFVTLLGPSGCGKSTLLRCLAGLTPVDSGQILLQGQDLVPLAPQKRGIGMVFQSYALFPNMTVEGNVAFGLKMQKLAAGQIGQRVQEALALVELSDLAKRYPHQLSGGQCQRVALARSLVTRPRLLLLDEPLSALDARIRKHLREQIRRIQRELNLTAIFVTHDQEEAMEVADRIVVMSQGNIEQVGSPEEIMREPASRFVLEFMGEVNRLNGEIRGSQLFVGAHQWPLSFQPMHQGSVDLFLRPWEMEVATESSERCPLPVQVLEVSPRGHFWQLTVQPIGWHQEPIGVVLPEGNATPVRGGRYYVGSLNARLYAGDQLLQPVALAKSA